MEEVFKDFDFLLKVTIVFILFGIVVHIAAHDNLIAVCDGVQKHKSIGKLTQYQKKHKILSG